VVSFYSGLDNFAWEWRYVDPETGETESKYLAGEEYPTRSDAETHLKSFVERLNGKR
jgi:hypothetical protein